MSADLERALEAALFAAEEPMSAEELAGFLRAAPIEDVREGLRALAGHYEARGVRLVERGGRWHFETAPDLAHFLRREREQVRKLSRAATEVLTSSGTLDVLMEEGWVRIAGRRESPGRPTIYATTPAFLDHFSLASRRDLPGIAELRAAGLLDPVEDAYDDLMGMGECAEDGAEHGADQGDQADT